MFPLLGVCLSIPSPPLPQIAHKRDEIVEYFRDLREPEVEEEGPAGEGDGEGDGLSSTQRRYTWTHGHLAHIYSAEG